MNAREKKRRKKGGGGRGERVREYNGLGTLVVTV